MQPASLQKKCLFQGALFLEVEGMNGKLSEVAAQRCSVKRMLLKILQNSQENSLF